MKLDWQNPSVREKDPVGSAEVAGAMLKYDHYQKPGPADCHRWKEPLRSTAAMPWCPAVQQDGIEHAVHRSRLWLVPDDKMSDGISEWYQLAEHDEFGSKAKNQQRERIGIGW